MRRRMLFFTGIAGLISMGSLVWNVSARAGYESAEYDVIESDGKFEVREYPDLTLASTVTQFDAEGRDGSFMKLFRYISGGNETGQKISMTTPVFMENGKAEPDVQMGFVMPKDVAVEKVPAPTSEDVVIRTRKGGRFAVIRFSGRLNTQLAKESEATLRAWMKAKSFVADDSTSLGGVESAAYDPPFTPAPLRRNEILIRLQSPQ